MNRAEELIADLEAEIVKRDARIVELDDELDTVLSDWGDMRLQLAALKAQPSAGVVDERAAFERLRAELAALKAGHGEAVAYVKPDSPIKGHTEFCRHETWMIDEGENIMIAGGWFPLYLSAQPASADAVSVPRELLERLCPKMDARHWHQWNASEAYQAACELRALLAQQGKAVGDE